MAQVPDSVITIAVETAKFQANKLICEIKNKPSADRTKADQMLLEVFGVTHVKGLHYFEVIMNRCQGWENLALIDHTIDRDEIQKVTKYVTQLIRDYAQMMDLLA